METLIKTIQLTKKETKLIKSIFNGKYNLDDIRLFEKSIDFNKNYLVFHDVELNEKNKPIVLTRLVLKDDESINNLIIDDIISDNYFGIHTINDEENQIVFILNIKEYH